MLLSKKRTTFLIAALQYYCVLFIVPKISGFQLSSTTTTTTTIRNIVSNRRITFLSATEEDDFSAFADSLLDEDTTPKRANGAATATTTTTTAKAPKKSTTTTTKTRVKPTATKKSTTAVVKETWQSNVDEIFNPTTNLARRQILLSNLINSNDEIRNSVITALRDRKIDPLLTPNGKKLQDGTRAVARQIANDILPTLAKTATTTATSTGSTIISGGVGGVGSSSSSSRTTRNGSRSNSSSNSSSSSSSSSSRNGRNSGAINNIIPPPTDITKVGSKILNAISNQVQRNIENLQNDLSNPVEKIPKRISEQTEGFVTEAKNVFSETPVGLKEIPYTVVEVTNDYEIRDYDSYAVATTTIPGGEDIGEPFDTTNVAGSGSAFNTLAAYLFGANEQGTSMEMTTPVTTTSWGEMRFYLHSSSSQSFSSSARDDDGDDDDNDTTSLFPSPLKEDTTKYETGSVEIMKIPATRLAVKRFTGFVTDGEIKRQKDALLTALELDNVELDVPHGEPITHVIFQYNPPYTIPIIRRNEIGVPVRRIEEFVDDNDNDGDEADDTDLESQWK